MSSLFDASCKSIAPSPPLDWERIISLEPRLAALGAEAAANCTSTSDAEFWPRWSRIKRQLSRLAGWDARREELASDEAYGIVYDHLLNLFELGGLLAEEVGQ